MRNIFTGFPTKSSNPLFYKPVFRVPPLFWINLHDWEGKRLFINKFTYTLEYFSKLLNIQGYVSLALPYYLSQTTAYPRLHSLLQSSRVAFPQALHPSAPTGLCCFSYFKLHGKRMSPALHLSSSLPSFLVSNLLSPLKITQNIYSWSEIHRVAGSIKSKYMC